MKLHKVTAEKPIDMGAIRAEITPFVEIMERPNREAGRPAYLHKLVENDDYAYNVYLYKKFLDKNLSKIKYYHECLKHINVDPGDMGALQRGVKGDHWTYGLNVDHLLTEPPVQPEDEPMGEPRHWKPLQE